MDEDTNYYKLENAIKNLNLLKMNDNEKSNSEVIIKQFNLEHNTKINIDKDFGSLSYEDHKFEEYFLNVDNDFNCSKILYSRIPYKEEFLGFKFYCNDKIIILIRELRKYSFNFIFHEVNTKDNNKDHNNDIKNVKNDNNKDYNNDIKNDKTDNNKEHNNDIKNDNTEKNNKIDNKNNDSKNNKNNENNNEYYYNFLKANLFDKIDYQDYNIKGYKYYAYFYIYSLFKNTEKEKELRKNNIFIKIIDDEIDEYIKNYINFSKEEMAGCNDYIYIYMLIIKEHCAVLIDINGSFFLFDSSYYFIFKLENIFKDLGDQIIILNKYKIQNLGTCSFHSMNFISVFISFILKDKKKFTKDLFNNINSYEFFFEYINQLSKFCRGKDLISEKNLENNFLLLRNKVYLNKYAYKINIINFNELFKFLSINELNIISLLIKKENLIYLKECKINYLIKNLENLIKNKYEEIDFKRDIIYNEEIQSFNKKTKVLDKEQIDFFYQGIYFNLKYKNEIFKQIDEIQLKEKIKENIQFKFKEKYLLHLSDSDYLKYYSNEKTKNIMDIIIELIKSNKKKEYFEDELFYYLKKQDLISKYTDNETKNILENIENFNKNINTKTGLEYYLEDLDAFLFKLDFILNKLEGFINDLQ